MVTTTILKEQLSALLVQSNKVSHEDKYHLHLKTHRDLPYIPLRYLHVYHQLLIYQQPDSKYDRYIILSYRKYWLPAL